MLSCHFLPRMQGILADLLLSFLKLWGVPTGMLANIPAVSSGKSFIESHA